MTSVSKLLTFLLVLVVSTFSVEAFVSKADGTRLTRQSVPVMTPKISTSALSERKWNFNEGQSPWGLKKNAEVWNGRVSQMAFVWVFLQELITGKGVFQGIQEGDLFFLANLGIFGVCLLGLTGWLAYKGDDDFTKQA